jgi:sugar O-acyltransferase (sialic acid O-acetyltransferase NeuD family)
MPAPLIVVGGGGHAKVCLDLALTLGWPVAGVCDPGLERGLLILGVPVLGGDEVWQEGATASRYRYALGLGQPQARRRRLALALFARGLDLPCLIHPAASVSAHAEIGAGSVIMAGARVNVDARIGRFCVVNTGATIDHDCVLADGAQVSPGATLAGGVGCAEDAFVGVGATVLPGIKLGARSLLAAGAVAVRDLPADVRARGVPATIITAAAAVEGAPPRGARPQE